MNFIDCATGSLGQGLSIAAGMAYCGKVLDKASYRTFCLMGDGESYEGNVWEALNFAGHYKVLRTEIPMHSIFHGYIISGEIAA